MKKLQAAGIRMNGKSAFASCLLLASLFNDYTAFVVNGASPLAAGKDLTERLKKDLDREYADLKAVKVELGLVRQ